MIEQPSKEPENKQEQDFQDFDFEATFHELKKSSQTSLTMVILGAACLIGSLVYSATRLAPLEQEIKHKSRQIEQLAATEQDYLDKIANAKQEYEKLRDNIEKLYAVKVTASHYVYELKATAKATGELIGENPAYNFAIYVNAPAATLQRIEKVTYIFDHPTFAQRERVARDLDDQFKIDYYGWGCLTNMKAILTMKDGESQTLDFNMCKSLGGAWWRS